MRFLLLLLIIIPAAEIALLLFSGKVLGVWTTFGMIILTGILGAYLAKKQGLETIRRAQTELQYGRVPGGTLLDGICILVGGLLLLLPGFITDIFGLILLAPPTRTVLKGFIVKFLKRWLDRGNIIIMR